MAVQTFRDYFKALAFLSYSLVIILVAIIKYTVLTFKGTVYPDLKPFFQLSIFLFIPILLILVFTKFKSDTLTRDASFEYRFPRWVCVTTIVLLHIVLILLFTYIIVAQ
jgi:hypothetical protein